MDPNSTAGIEVTIKTRQNETKKKEQKEKKEKTICISLEIGSSLVIRWDSTDEPVRFILDEIQSTWITPSIEKKWAIESREELKRSFSLIIHYTSAT